MSPGQLLEHRRRQLCRSWHHFRRTGDVDWLRTRARKLASCDSGNFWRGLRSTRPTTSLEV